MGLHKIFTLLYRVFLATIFIEIKVLFSKFKELCMQTKDAVLMLKYM